MNNIQWTKIKNAIRVYCKNAFKEQNISISENDISGCIDIFYNLLSKNIPYAMLNGLGRTMLPALQESCCDNPACIQSFLVIKTQVDSVLKILLILTGKKTYTEVTGKGTKQLFVWTNVVPSYTMQAPSVTRDIAESYKGRPDGLYLFAYTDYCRNQVHESPDDDASVVTYGLKHVLSFYVYMIFRMKGELLSAKPEYGEIKFTQISDTKGERMYYDFINYGQAANAIKNRFVNSFIFETLYNLDIEKCQLVDKMLVFSKNTLKRSSAERIIDKLKGNNRIIVSASNIVSLSEDERNRLNDAYLNYAERINDFQSQLDSFIYENSLNCEKSELFDVIKTFFENNFNTDLIEISNDIEIEERNELHILFDKLKEFRGSDENISGVVTSLLQICKRNDILVRLGMSKLYSKISNPETFQQYASSSNRKVYVDTQLIIYALCVNMDLGTSENKRFISMKNLLNAVSGKEGIRLILSRHYLSEVSYHLRQALLLIPFADRYAFFKKELSSNVFYRYYYELRDKNMLENNINSFADFIYEAFGFEESDAYLNSFWDSSISVLEDIIYNDIGIEIERLPIYSDDQIKKASDIFQVFFTELKSKSEQILKNDAIMGAHLFCFPIEEPEPFFLTWDSMFTQFRKEYIKVYKRTNQLYWHLFSPMKFVNHMDLLNLNVDVDKLSDDILTMIETDEYRNHTTKVIDKFSKVLDISGIDAGKRRKYINMISDEMFNEQEFPNTVEPEYIDLQLDMNKVADIFDRLLDHYRELGQESLTLYIKHILNEDFFKHMVISVKDFISRGDNALAMRELISDLDTFAEEMFKLET